MLFLLVAVLDIGVARALHFFLKPVHESLSLLAAILRTVYAAILGAVIAFLLQVLELSNGAWYAASIEPGLRHTRMRLSIGTFNRGWNAGWQFSDSI